MCNRIDKVAIEVNEELRNLREIQASRSATRNTNQVPVPATVPSRNEKLSAGDEIRVTRGRNQGVKGRILRETPAQYLISLEHVEGTFRKWKNNVKKA